MIPLAKIRFYSLSACNSFTDLTTIFLDFIAQAEAIRENGCKKPYCVYTVSGNKSVSLHYRIKNMTMKYMWMMLFFVLPLAGLAYVLWHVWCLLPVAAVWRGVVLAVGVLAFLTLFLIFSRSIDRLPLPLATVCYETGTSALIVLLYLVMAFLLLDAGRLVGVVPRTWLHANATVSGVLALLMVVVFVGGNIHYNNKVRQPLDLPTDKPLGRKLTIVMMSDLHLGYHNRRAELAHWVDMVNAEHPDMVLIAGDIIDISVRPLIEEGMADEFRRINAPVYACLGNHEYLSGEQRALRFYEEAGVTLLRDSVVTVGDVVIAGRDDRMNVGRKSVAELLKGVDRDKYLVLLDHQPYHLDRSERAGVDFQLSGHTHHGQVWPASWITDAIYECAFGQWQRGRTRYYISSGMGIWGGKFRIGTRSEYIVATLHN